jgi:type I restriction enzyme M protein
MSNLKGVLDSIRKIMWTDTGLNGDAQRIEQLGWMLFLKIFSDKDKELEIIKDDYESPIPAEFHWDEWAGDDEGITGDELQAFVDQKLFPTLRNLKVGMSDVVYFFEGNKVIPHANKKIYLGINGKILRTGDNGQVIDISSTCPV